MRVVPSRGSFRHSIRIEPRFVESYATKQTVFLLSSVFCRPASAARLGFWLACAGGDAARSSQCLGRLVSHPIDPSHKLGRR